MPFDQDDLVGCLAMSEVEPGVVEGRNLDIGYHRVFGGQILAQPTGRRPLLARGCLSG